ncbi:methyltransferase domain-containing protein [Gloeocapsopsis crepidinum LEGE 06123]|uniref:Methyltransferase domain-containing protein n=1 Tax=Gloeocapsopsis crepidinum LEGE 06123 TaxID=588587 RepID=A0ABR9UX50_9CHRO|nr:class I SAM-dependent methyltransferase [Gloeocapsopsis crepidinum]MBE9192849.1 methyltransferase domain-containing protein [Gloeocapsopsis crepidinum LEGE 06123]
MHNQWDAKLYDRNHSFVSELATDLIDLLAPQAGDCATRSTGGDRILDLGCGTGYLANKIASRGAKVVGIDYAETMIEQARSKYPHLQFEVLDAKDLQYKEEFDAVFSNAALHWITEPEKVVFGIHQALKPGGRFVAEFGGKGNIKAIIQAIHNAVANAGYSENTISNPWYFPSIGEYGSLLEKHNLQPIFATLFDRPPRLEEGDKGMQNWLRMFANSFLNTFSADQQVSIISDIENQLRPVLYQNDAWFADYRRIRIVAVKE